MQINIARYKVLLGMVALVFVLNLLVLNDAISPFLDAEINSLAQSGWQNLTYPQETTSGVHFSLPKHWFAYANDNLFVARLAGVLFLVASLLGAYSMGKRLFGQQRMLYSMLVLMASFAVVNISKFAMADVWSLGTQILLFFSLILYLKQPIAKWRNLHFSILILGALVAPLPSAIFGIGLWTYLHWMHPKGKNLRKMRPWMLWVISAGFAIFQGTQSHAFAWDSPLLYFLGNLGGMVLFLAFLLPALWNTIRRIKKKEEFSILILGGILLSILSFSWSLQFFFALLVAQQMNDYFKQNYPYESVVKIIALLSTIAAFCVAMFYMLNGFISIGATGFRAAMLLSLAYWIPNFVFLIGLYSKKPTLVKGGLLSAGVLLTFIFWMHTAPYLVF